MQISRCNSKNKLVEQCAEASDINDYVEKVTVQEFEYTEMIDWVTIREQGKKPTRFGRSVIDQTTLSSTHVYDIITQI